MKKLFILVFILCSIQANDPTAFIEKVVNESLTIVNKDNIGEEEKRKALSECVSKYLEVKLTAEAVFSPFGYNSKDNNKKLSDDDKKKAQDYLKKCLLDFYASKGKLQAMFNAELVTPMAKAKQKGDCWAVVTKFIKKGQPPEKATKIVWIVVQSNGEYKIYYTEIEGVNQITTLRSEMKSNIGEKPLMDFINGELAK